MKPSDSLDGPTSYLVSESEGHAAIPREYSVTSISGEYPVMCVNPHKEVGRSRSLDRSYGVFER
jgi:hypothetical protein